MTHTKLYISPSFYVFWALFCLLDNEGILPLFVCAAAIHETGHIAAIYACGGNISRLELSAVGAVLQQGKNLGYLADCTVSLAGPAAGMAAAWIFSAAGMPMLAGANVLLSLCNCLPLLPLDGGCALYSLFSLLPAAISAAAQMALSYFSFFAAFALSAFGAVMLIHTKRNATMLVMGLFLLHANQPSLRKSSDYGMME